MATHTLDKASLARCSVVLLLLSLRCGTSCALRDALDRPNFVVFFVDDLGYGDCGFTGHPTTSTPNIDTLAYNGKILSTWYSACAVCSCSRASLMTGRQFPRTGVPPVFNATDAFGLNLQEITLAEQLKREREDNKTSYTTAIVGKWHLGQRLVYLPGSRGFDYYLGLPYSVDMGNALYSTCGDGENPCESSRRQTRIGEDYVPFGEPDGDAAGYYIPLVYQEHNRTRILEQPVDFTTLSEKYNKFATNFIEKHRDEPFFLYVPFSHVHVTSGLEATNDDDRGKPLDSLQFSSCDRQNCTRRSQFGDGLADVDSMVGNIMEAIRKNGLDKNTLVFFTSDNGPAVRRQVQGGSTGIFTGRYATYPDTGKGTTWEGGIRAPAFAYWKDQIEPFSRSSETVSTMDIFPTLSHFAQVSMPTDRIYDGKNMANILLRKSGTCINDETDAAKSQHDFLFFYGFCNGAWPRLNITAVRHGPFKAHFCTASAAHWPNPEAIEYYPYPLLFNVDQDPGEQYPISGTNGDFPTDPIHAAAVERIMKAYAMEKATFEYGPTDPFPPGPGEGPGTYGLCCDRTKDCFCADNTGSPNDWIGGILNIGTQAHHDRYHKILGEDNPLHTQVENT